MTQPLNYCRQLRKFVESREHTSEYYERYKRVEPRITAAIKFTLPDDGILLEDADLRAIDETVPLRLPYPSIALEYLIVTPADTGDVILVGCIILATESAEGIVTELLARTKEGRWLLPLVVTLPREGYMDRLERIGGSPCLYGVREDGERIRIGEYNDQHMVLLSFLNALSCSNVAIEKPAVSPVRRAIKTALPFDAYHIVVIDASPSSAGNTGASHTGRRPREHMRRGHIRRYETGLRIWVNACVVAAGGNKIHKEYAIRRAA